MATLRVSPRKLERRRLLNHKIIESAKPRAECQPEFDAGSETPTPRKVILDKKMVRRRGGGRYQVSERGAGGASGEPDVSLVVKAFDYLRSSSILPARLTSTLQRLRVGILAGRRLMSRKTSGRRTWRRFGSRTRERSSSESSRVFGPKTTLMPSLRLQTTHRSAQLNAGSPGPGGRCTRYWAVHQVW